MNLTGRRFENSRLDMEIFVYDIDGKEWFIGKDIAGLLGYKDPSAAVRDNINRTYKNTMYLKTIENIGCKPITINNNRSFITKEGVLRLISRSTKLTQQQKKEWYNMFSVEEVLISRKEIEFGGMLKEALNELGIKVVSQYNIDGKYRIDFYIPQLNIAVEYDEGHHQHQEKEDREREEYIQGRIGCKFIRCDYRDSDIKNVMKVVKEIM